MTVDMMEAGNRALKVVRLIRQIEDLKVRGLGSSHTTLLAFMEREDKSSKYLKDIMYYSSAETSESYLRLALRVCLHDSLHQFQWLTLSTSDFNTSLRSTFRDLTSRLLLSETVVLLDDLCTFRTDLSGSLLTFSDDELTSSLTLRNHLSLHRITSS